MQTEQQRPSKWQIDKHINVGHIITTVTVVGCLFVWGSTVDSRLAEHEIQIKNNSDDIAESESRSAKAVERVYDILDKMDAKLDRFLERK